MLVPVQDNKYINSLLRFALMKQAKLAETGWSDYILYDYMCHCVLFYCKTVQPL